MSTRAPRYAANRGRLLPMNRPVAIRHARNPQAGIQEGWGVDSRLKIAGMTLIGSLGQLTSQQVGPVLGVNGMSGSAQMPKIRSHR